jgi:hypothetical protein
MTQRTCATCGEPYTPHRKDQRYCGAECHRRRTQPNVYRPYDSAKARAKYRRRKLRLIAATLAQWTSPPMTLALPPGPAPTKTCAICPEPHMRQGKYCSKTCAANAKLIADRAASRARTLTLRSFTAGYCGECGGAFVSPGSRCDRFCSGRCSKRNRRRRDKQTRSKRINTGVKRETIDLPRLAFRDGWRCHICHRKVTRKTWSHDHLIPLSAGGSHTWDNVALAHVLCNSLRGAHGHAQLRLAA